MAYFESSYMVYGLKYGCWKFCDSLLFAVDTTPPECVNLPADITEFIELGTPGTLVTWQEPTCRDNSGNAFLTVRSHTPSSFFVPGTTAVTYTCMDIAGLTGECSFNIVVIERECFESHIVSTVSPHL